MSIVFFLNKDFIHLESVRMFETDSFFVNLSMLEFSYGFQTLHNDFCNIQVQFRKCNNFIIIPRKSACQFFQVPSYNIVINLPRKLPYKGESYQLHRDTDRKTSCYFCYKMIKLFKLPNSLENEISLKAKLFYLGQVRPSVLNGQLFSFIQACQNCPIGFKLCMVIPVVVRYDLESEATL